MNRPIDKRFSILAAHVLFPVAVGLLCVFLAAPVARAQQIPPGSIVTDPLGVASFVPPQGWARWNFWGLTAFSPTSLHTPRITFAVTSGDFSAPGYADKVLQEYVSAFSTQNYTLILKENLYLGGWPGVRVLAQGTEKNTLFGSDYIWIQDYFTKDKKISLVFRCEPALFETYRDTVLTSFRSLVISEDGQDGQ
jgi:hypothetical protein